jgi:hypothetical protein
MRKGLEVIGVAALISVVAFKALVGPGKLVAETKATIGQKSFFGLHIAQPQAMKSFPAEPPLP